MSEEKIITENYIVDEKEVVEQRFEMLMGTELDWNYIINYISIRKENAFFFFDNELKKMQKNDKNITYVWLDTGYKTEHDEVVFLALVNHFDCYSGHFIGTGKYLMRGMCNKNPRMIKKLQDNYQLFAKKYRKVIERQGLALNMVQMIQADKMHGLQVQNCVEDIRNHDMNVVIPQIQDCETQNIKEEYDICDISEKIYSELNYPNWQSVKGLDSFIKVVGKRIGQLIEKNDQEYYVMNKLGSVVVNTGLMNIFGNDYFVMYRKHISSNSYIAYKVMTGKKDYLDEDFSIEQSSIDIKPICFFNKGEKVFQPDIEEFDINTRDMRHIIEERRDRFPEKIRNDSVTFLAGNIMQMLEQGLKLQKRDSSYAKPIYSNGKISWLLPLRFGTKITEEPELVLVIRKVGEFYQVKTILPYSDEVKDKITCVSLYRNIW